MAQIISTGDLTDKIIVDTTTVHPDTSKAVSAKLTQESAFLVSGMLLDPHPFCFFFLICLSRSCYHQGPVFGSAPMAAERNILMAAAGTHCTMHRISPYIKGVIARDMLEVAEEPEKASLLKIIG